MYVGTLRVLGDVRKGLSRREYRCRVCDMQPTTAHTRHVVPSVKVPDGVFADLICMFVCGLVHAAADEQRR